MRYLWHTLKKEIIMNENNKEKMVEALLWLGIGLVGMVLVLIMSFW